MAAARGLDITISATTDRRAALRDCDAVLSSFRPGGFQARALDERIPLDMGVMGQETQGPGGFFMALRAIAVLKELCAEMEEVCPDAWIFNYTNPVNIVAEAATHHSSLKIVSLCEGPIYFVDEVARVAELERSELAGDDGRPEPRLLERRAHLPRRGCDPRHPGRLGATPRRPQPEPVRRPAAAPGGDHGIDPGGVLQVLLLPRRGGRRAARPSRRPAPRTS